MLFTVLLYGTDSYKLITNARKHWSKPEAGAFLVALAIPVSMTFISQVNDSSALCLPRLALVSSSLVRSRTSSSRKGAFLGDFEL